MRASMSIFLLVISVSLCRGISASMRNLSEIQYHFTTCGSQGSSGPEFSMCLEEYTRSQSPITRDGLLSNFAERGGDYYRGAQRFRVPRTGMYNVTVAGAAGGRGICSSTSGKGQLWRGRVFLSEDQDLLILVGQKGLGPCDADAVRTRDLPLCFNPPANLSEVDRCDQEWMDWINNDPMLPIPRVEAGSAVLITSGGGGGGGASFILPFSRASGTVNAGVLPIVIAPGGGGTSAMENHTIFNVTERPGPADLPNDEQYLLLINGQNTSFPTGQSVTVSRGSRGFINTSANPGIRPGAGGGWSASDISTNAEGKAIGIEQQFALGGQDCASRLSGSFAPHIPIRNVNGGFGGGGGYTGGSIFASLRSVPGGGGYFYGPQDAGYDINSFVQLSLDLNQQGDGYVEIVPVDCGCAYDCIVYEDMFECICPNGFKLTPNKVDCLQGSEVNITLLPSQQQGGITFTPVVFNSSFNVFGVHALLEYPNERVTSAGWSCSILLLGKNNDIVAATQPVRGNLGVTESLARVNSSNFTISDYQSLLTTPVTVTGALLVSTESCSIVGSSIQLNVSFVESQSAGLVEEDFDGLNYGMVEILAHIALSVLSTTLDATTMTITPNKDPTIMITAVVVAIFVAILIVAVALVSFILFRRLRNTKGPLYRIYPKRKHNDYSQNLTANQAYVGKNFSSDPQHRQEINKFYEPGPPSHASLEGEGYESISYDANGIKRLSMKRRTSINASARFFSPRHGIAAPDHDFTPFNMQRSQYRDWEYPRKNLIYLKELGEGEFGKVLLMKAQSIADYKGEIPVAVKTLSFKNQHLLDKFMEEINLMKKFAHPNIVGLLGTSTRDISEDSAPLMILEYMPFGDLHTFLSKHKPTILRKSQKRIGPAHFFSFSKDVAEALAFLASQKHVHRDIAARNCLVGTGLQVKIADFGMARSFSSDKEFYKVEGKAVLPIRWLAPESLLYGIFSTASDVWSYGVLLWEIVTYGELPLTDLKTDEIVELAQAEELKHLRPVRCPDEIYDVICRCHKHGINERITFDQIMEEFSREDILKLMGEKEIAISGVH